MTIFWRANNDGLYINAELCFCIFFILVVMYSVRKKREEAYGFLDRFETISSRFILYFVNFLYIIVAIIG